MSLENQIKDFIRNLPEAESARYEKLPREKKLQFIEKLGDRFSQAQFDDTPSAVGAGLSIAQGLQREEAAFAEPLIDIAAKVNPTFGQERIDSTLSESFSRGAKGQSISPFNPNRQAEFGDVGRQLGLPEPVSAGLGLSASAFLPSGIGLGLIGRIGARTATSLGRGAFKKAVRGVTAGVTTVDEKGLDRTYRNVFRILEAQSGKEKLVGAETIESLTGIDSKNVLFALQNPEVLNRSLAQDGVLSDVAKEGAEHLTKNLQKGRGNLVFPQSAFGEMADDISNSFNKTINDAGAEIGRQKSLLSDLGKEQLSMNKGELIGFIDRLIDEKRAFTTVDNVKVLRESADDNTVVKALLKAKRVVNGLTGKQKTFKILDSRGIPIKTKPIEVVGPDELLFLQDTINDIAFNKDFTTNIQGIEQPIKGVSAALQRFSGFVSGNIKKKAADAGLNDFGRAFERFSSLADTRLFLKKVGRNKESLTKFLRKFNDTAKETPEVVEDFLGALKRIPNGNKILSNIVSLNQVSQNSPDAVFPFIKSGNKADIEKGLLGILKKNANDITDVESRTLEKILPEELLFKTVGHKVSKAFSQKANFFRALAAGGAFGLFGGPDNALGKALTGFAITDPRLAGLGIREGIPKARAIGKGISSLGASVADPLAKSGLVRASVRKALSQE